MAVEGIKKIDFWAFLLFLLSASISFEGSVRAAEIIVSPGQRVQDALDIVGPGDTVLIKAGVYAEALSLPTSGTGSKPIRVKAYGDGEVVFETASTMVNINKEYWIFQGLTFDHQNGASDAIKVSSSGRHVTFRQCELRNGQRDGIDGRGEEITVENCQIHDFLWSGGDAHCIVLNPGSGSSPAATGWKIHNNTIYNCGGDGVQLYASSSTPLENSTRDIDISGNTIYTTLGQNSENAIDCKGVVNGLFKNNEMYGFEDKAVVVQKGSRNLLVEGNIIHDSQRGMEFRGEDGKRHDDLTVRRNILYNIQQYYALKFDEVYDATVVHNTLAYIAPPSIRIEGKGMVGGLLANNLTVLAGPPVVSGSLTGLQLSHNGWFQTDSGDLGSVNDTHGDDPRFVDGPGGDFRLAVNSPVIDQGKDIGLPFNGSAPDLGAKETGGQPNRRPNLDFLPLLLLATGSLSHDPMGNPLAFLGGAEFKFAH